MFFPTYTSRSFRYHMSAGQPRPRKQSAPLNTIGTAQIERLEDRTLLSQSNIAIPKSIPGSFEYAGEEFQVRLNSVNGNGIDPSRPTWILIHGFRNSPSDWAATMGLADITRRFPTDTVLTFDWSSAAITPYSEVWHVESRIQSAATWLAETLVNQGFQSNQIKFIGHSFGSYVANETAEILPGKVRGIIALNPAKDVSVIGLGDPFQSSDPTQVSFHENAEYSWAFVNNDGGGSDLADSVVAASTAANSFIVQNDFHSLPDMFSKLLQVEERTNANYRFDIERMFGTTQWELDQYTDSGVVSGIPGDGRHEGYILLSNDDEFIFSEFFPVGNSNRLLGRTPQKFGAVPIAVTNLTTGLGSTLPQRANSFSASAESIRISDEVENFAATTSDSTDVIYYASRTSLDSSPLYEVGRRTLPALGPGYTSRGSYQLPLADVPTAAISGGRTYIGVAIDDGSPPDPDEMWWQTVNIPSDFGVADLVGDDFDLDPAQTTYAWGQSLEASFRVENIGSGYAGPFEAAVYLSQDAVFDESDYRLAGEQFPGLQGGSNAGTSLWLSLPVSPPSGFSDGTMYIGVVVDSQNDVPGEVSESNNSGRGNAIDYRVISVANLSPDGTPTIGSFSIDTNMVIRGEKVTLTATGVVDDGVVNDVRYYLDSNGNLVLDEEDQFVGYGSKAGSTFTTRVDTTSWPVGNYAVFAQAVDNFGNLSPVLQVPVTVLGNGPAVPDAYERNDTWQSAHYLGGADTYQINNLSITHGDTDWFSFTIADGEADIDIAASFFQESNGKGDLFLELLRLTPSNTVQTVQFVDSSNSGNTLEHISRTNASDDVYFVRIGHQNHGLSDQSNPDYDLRIEVSPTAGARPVGLLKSSDSEIHAGDSLDVWFDWVGGGSIDSNSGAVFYHDTNKNGLIDVSEDQMLGVDWGPLPSLNDKFGVTATTGNWQVGPNVIHAFFFGSGDNSITRSITINVLGNREPTIELLAGPAVVTVGQSLALTATTVLDPDGSVTGVVYQRDENDNGIVDGGDISLGNGTRDGDDWGITIDTSGWESRSHRILAVATDDRGAKSDPVELVVEVEEPINQSPIIGSFDIPGSVGRGTTIVLTTREVDDPDGDLLDPVQFFIDRNNDTVIDGGDLPLGAGIQTDDDWSIEFDTSTVPEGALSFIATVQESGGGLVATVSGTTSVTVPLLVGLINEVDSLPHAFDVGSGFTVADIIVGGTAAPTSTLSLSGPDADAFEVVDNELRLRNGVDLDYHTNQELNVVVNADSPEVAESPGDSVTYRLAINPPPARVGNWVWLDANEDGIQNGNERGARVPGGMMVRLFEPGSDGTVGGGDDVLVDSTTTNKWGRYEFADVAPGDYFIEFVQPDGFDFSPFRTGNWKVDSNADETTGRTELFPVLPGRVDHSRDAGLIAQTGTIGDRVWIDDNANGRLDGGEQGVRVPGGMTVYLLDAGADRAIGGGDDLLVASTQTNKWGVYQFDSVAPSTYYLQFLLPNGFAFTQQNAAVSWKRDSDADPSTGLTTVFQLAPGKRDFTRDAGLVSVPPPVIGQMIESPRSQSIPEDVTKGDDLIVPNFISKVLPEVAVPATVAENDFPAGLFIDDDDEIVAGLDELLTLDRAFITAE